MTCSRNGLYGAAYKIIFLSLLGQCSAIADEKNFLNYFDSSLALSIEAAVDENTMQKTELIIMPEINVDLSNANRLTAIARLRADAQENIDPNNQTEGELHEFYWETSISRTLLTLGKQQIVWGKADGLKVLDVVNPQDYREFILDEFSHSRIPIWSLNAELPIGDSTLQFIWLPDQTYHKFAKSNGLYAFTSSNIIPKPPPGAQLERKGLDEPGNRLTDSDVGFRYSTFMNGWDLTLNYLYHYVDTPVLFRQLITTNEGLKISISPSYERSHLVGGTFSNAFGELTLRGEVGYSFKRYVSTNDSKDTDGVIQTDELAYVLGLDWYGISNSLLSVQLFQSHLLEGDRNLIQDKTDTTITALMKREFMNDTLSSELLWLHNLNADDGLLRPKITYNVNDEIKWWFGLDVFYGDSNGLFGQFNEQDRIVSGIEITI